MTKFNVKIVREAGPEPVDGSFIPRAEETVEVTALTPWEAHNKAVMAMSINPYGRLLRFYDADSGEEITYPEAEPAIPSLEV